MGGLAARAIPGATTARPAPAAGFANSRLVIKSIEKYGVLAPARRLTYAGPGHYAPIPFHFQARTRDPKGIQQQRFLGEQVEPPLVVVRVADGAGAELLSRSRIL